MNSGGEKGSLGSTRREPTVVTSVSSEAQSILVNGEPRAVEPGCTVDRLLGSLDLQGRRVAVAVNRIVIPRSSFGSTRVAPGDRIEILEAVGGG
jgi:sulfur carrier protein